MHKDGEQEDMKNILIAAGGTGGHIFPAIVFGKNLQARGENVSWLCGSRELEHTIYNASGIDPIILPLAGSPFGVKSPAKIFSRILDVFRSLRQVMKYSPDEIYLFGGYISFAPLIMAKLKRIPVTLHEQNTVAGRVTRIASRMGVKIFTGWPVCIGIKSFEYVGIPVREPVRLSRHDALSSLGLNIPEGSKIVGVAGGSLGSGPLSEVLKSAAKLCPEHEFMFLSAKSRHDDGNTHFLPAMWDMNPFYSACDILVCRAGGSTLAEAMKWELPTISIPWPGAANNHQVKNAEEFVKLDSKARMFCEDDSPESLAEIIRKIIPSS